MIHNKNHSLIFSHTVDSQVLRHFLFQIFFYIKCLIGNQSSKIQRLS
jgi:hypothetical protein